MGFFSSLPKYPGTGDDPPVRRPEQTLGRLVLFVVTAIFGAFLLHIGPWMLVCSFGIVFVFFPTPVWIIPLVLLMQRPGKGGPPVGAH